MIVDQEGLGFCFAGKARADDVKQGFMLCCWCCWGLHILFWEPNKEAYHFSKC